MNIDWKNGVVVDIQAAALKKTLKQMDISQPQFALRAEIPYEALNKYLAGRRNLKADEAEKIKKAISGLSESVTFGNEWLPRPEPCENLIPIYGYSIANAAARVQLTVDSVIGQTRAHPSQSNFDKCFAIEILSDEYSPRYKPGELIYAIWNKPPTKSQDFIVELKAGNCEIRSFISLSGSELLTESVNNSQSKAYRLGDIAHLHAIVGTGFR